jgi:tRNA (uracil-5-)-methyltransferase TRM9
MEDQKKVWNSIAPSWDERRQMISPAVKDFIMRTEGKLLDLGCGSGRNFWRVRGQKLYGVDFSNEMIKFARENAKKKKIKGDFSVMDADELDFEDNFFEGVLCWAVLHCIDSRERRVGVMKEVYRVLKPGGEALISSWGKDSPRLKNKGKECFIPWSGKDDKREMRYTYVYDLDEFEDDLIEAGFEIDKTWKDKNVNAIVKKPF